MTKIIITPAQLKMINESELRVTANSAGGSDLLNAATNANVGQNNQGIKVVVPGNTGEEYSTTLPELQKGSDIPQDASSVYIEPTGNASNSLGESRFSKRQVELGRMLEMRRTSKVFSKKQLNEMFMETQENADELRNIFKNGGGRNLAFKVAEIIDDVFPEESYGSELLDAVLGGADPAEFIIQNIFTDFADKEQEREVLDRIRELTTKRGF